MKQFPHLDIALTCVLTACKAEETYKKIKQILAAAFVILNPNFKGNDVDIKVYMIWATDKHNIFPT